MANDGSGAMEIYVTAHAIERGRKRVGLKRRAVQRAAEIAWRRGLALAERPETSADCVRKLHGGYCYVFKINGGVVRLVTIAPSRETKDWDADEADAVAGVSCCPHRLERKRRLGRRLGWKR